MNVPMINGAQVTLEVGKKEVKLSFNTHGLLQPDGGEIRLFGKQCPLHPGTASDFQRNLLADRIGVVLGAGAFYENLTIRQMKQAVAPAYSSWQEDEFRKLSKRFGLEPLDVYKRQDVSRLLSMLHEDLESGYPAANEAAGVKPDRGALRALVWGEKVSRIVNSILQRYEKEGDALLEHTNIYVCDICGFIYIGDTPPALCPVCKVPGWKMTKVERGQAG